MPLRSDLMKHTRLVIAVVLLGAARLGHAAEPAASAAPPAASADKSIEPLLATLQSDAPATERLEAAAALAAAGPTAIPALEKFLARPRKSTDAERRAVLAAIDAQVPDQKGRFKNPGREGEQQKQADDALDWLAKLVELGPMPGLGEVVADVAAIRALAATPSAAAGEVVLDFAFSDVGLVFRDECGRYLRKMMPYSLPALIHADGIRKKYSSKRRYAKYQLERLDRENPAKALEAAAADPRLEADIFLAWRDTRAREPIPVILKNLDHVSPLVRAAAREAWMALVTGKPPPDAPKRKLVLPGGELTKEEQPLWLNSREMADVALHREIERLYGEPADRRATLEELSKKLFAYYDNRRAAQDEKLLDAGLAAAKEGDWKQATTDFDRVLAEHPEHPRRAEMAPAYVAAGKALRKEKKYRDAALAFRKATLLAPDRDDNKTLLASYHQALGKALQAEGHDGSAELHLAATLQPDARAFEDEDTDSAGQPWLLYGGGAIGLLALLLLVLGLRARRS